MATSRTKEGELTLGGVSVARILSDANIPTPAYVYDVDSIANEVKELSTSFQGDPHLVAYAVKANSAGPIVRAVRDAGGGADVVSGGELALVEAAGISPEKIVFSGVAKTNDEIDRALSIGPSGIFSIQAESVEEIGRIARRAEALGRTARLSFRLNPGVDFEEIDTHANIATGHDEAKFGIPLSLLEDALRIVRANPSLKLQGIGAHVGSQLTSTAGYLTSANALFALTKKIIADGFPLAFVDTGGGFGIDYGAGCPVRPADFVKAVRAEKKKAGLDGVMHIVEPGRSIVGAHGILIASVIQQKVAGERRWLMIDAGMNDLMRPALYQARHRVVAVAHADRSTSDYRVVGPVCESSDDFGVHSLPEMGEGKVALLDAGAYGYSMASMYNARALPAEIFVRDGRIAEVASATRVEDWVRDRLERAQAR